jgi:hypothetical protein
MKRPGSVNSLENLGRVRLSENFFMRDFLYSEVANLYGIPNIPDHPDLAIETGRALCENLLEPLREKFGRISIRSAYRCREVARVCNERGHNCAKPESEYAEHIWDRRTPEGIAGAMATVIVHEFIPYYQRTGRWEAMAWWVHDHLPYSSMLFFQNFRRSISAGARSRSGGSGASSRRDAVCSPRPAWPTTKARTSTNIQTSCCL